MSSTAYYPGGPVDPLAAAIAEMFSATPLSTVPLDATRAVLAANCAMTGTPEMPVSNHTVGVTGGEIGLRLYRPAGAVPAVIAWSHGGGFALGTLDQADNFCRLLAHKTGCAVASIDYRLAPEHRFPTAVDDVEAAALWLSAHRAALGLGDAPVWLGGDSAGGNLSTVVTRRLHHAGRAEIAGNLLVYPCTDSPDAESLRRFVPPFMRVEECTWFIDMYLPGPEYRLHPDFAPLHAEGLEVLPPTLVITAEHDVITEQAEAYGMKLAGLGVPVQIERVPGQIHGFLTLDPFLPGVAGETIDRMAAFMRAV
ncbi:MAG: alpha/beta hydrolase [Sphingomonadales bacterium]|nr:alpha/beta hydrolase [Sphingomonadales bacterium]